MSGNPFKKAKKSIKKVFKGDGKFKNIINTVADPGNVFGKRKGGMTMAGMIDPGGEILKSAGIKEGRQIADPGNLLSSPQMMGILPEMPEMPEMPNPQDELDRKAEETRKRELEKRGRASTILAGSSNGGFGSANVGSRTLGGR